MMHTSIPKEAHDEPLRLTFDFAGVCVLKSGLPIRRAEKIASRMGFLCRTSAYCDLRKQGNGPERGRFATNQRKIL